MDKLKVFISMPMDGKSKSEIDEAFKKESENVRAFIAEEGYKDKKDYDIECFSGYVELKENPNVRNSALNYLGASLQKLAEADALWMSNGWLNARGCRTERICALKYGTDILNDTDENKDWDEAWDAVKTTPEYKDWEEADKAVEATPEWKALKKAEKAVYATSEWKALKEVERAEEELRRN